jgi:hypothetical protein
MENKSYLQFIVLDSEGATMKKTFLLQLLLFISLVAVFGESNRYVSKIGRLDHQSIDGITEYFGKDSKTISLEVFINLIDGNAIIMVINPEGQKIDTIEVKNEMINIIQKQYKMMKGNWRIAVYTNHGNGNYVLKIHDDERFIGIDEQERKYLRNGIAWYIDK